MTARSSDSSARCVTAEEAIKYIAVSCQYSTGVRGSIFPLRRDVLGTPNKHLKNATTEGTISLPGLLFTGKETLATLVNRFCS
jgi:hypothetical protein